MSQIESQDLSSWQWLYLPIFVTLLPFVARIIDPATDNIIFGEMGVMENLTVIFLLIGIFAGLRSFLGTKTFPVLWMRPWLLILILGSVYFAGEELSWGQHYFGWETPEGWGNVNDQQETNLHNTSALFDQVPRTLLTIAALVGGIIVPLVLISRGKRFDPAGGAYWLWPTYIVMPASIGAIFVSFHEKAYKLFDSEVPFILDIRAGETKECLLAMFIMLYMLSLYKRLKIFSS